jgi:hypothetical protein
MEEANIITSITLVTYPSNHCLVNGPKIALIGAGREWKEELFNEVNNFWPNMPITFFYIDSDQYDLDNLSWLYLNLKNVDYIIGQINNNIDDISILAPFCQQPSTFLMFADIVALNMRSWFVELNPNKDYNSTITIILKIKELLYK